MKKTSILFMAILAAVVFTGTAFAQVKMHPDATPNTADSRASKYTWTESQVKEWFKKPWTQEELSKMGEGDFVMDKQRNVLPRHTGNNLTPKQLYENGRSLWFPVVAQFGIGINTKDFKKLWIDQEKWKDPNHILLDVRNEYEFNQGHIPGALRLDPGLDYWLLPARAPKQNATYYLQCKGGTRGDGGDRGAFTKQRMIDMGYTGPIINLTDGYRGWIEAGFPSQNFHGQWTLVPGTFQQPDPYGKAQLDKGPKQDSWAPTVW